ncbi:MAG: glutamate-5-semialdehyde dehydrogenase [Hyphomonadaceae bacterium]
MDTTTDLIDADLADTMEDMGKRARAAAKTLGLASPDARTKALIRMAELVRANTGDILDANAMDMDAARAKGISPSMLDRLELSMMRIEAIADGLDAVAALDDPVGRELARWTVPSGLDIARVSTPLGVIGIIYESRPNVTADAGALCIRSGNAAILRGGSESTHSSGAIADVLRQALRETGLPEDAIQKVQTVDRAAVGHMLSGLGGSVDVIVPRGGRSLVERVQADARVPVIGHLEGLVHMYVDGSLPLEETVEIVLNAKLRRTGICGALETLLIDARAAAAQLAPLVAALQTAGCEIRADARARALVPDLLAADDDDWRTEYLAATLSIKLVDGLDGALGHIDTYGSGHTECILTSDEAAAARFFEEVDAGIVMHNASTQFADGGQFGMGAEIGIATGRIHARGPVGAEQLTLFKYIVRGNGQTRAP